MSRVVVYFAPSNARSKLIAQAMIEGVRRHVPDADYRSSFNFKGPDHDVALFYGFADGLRNIFNRYIEAGKKAVYIDLGWFHRRKKTRWDGYHKVVVNSRHPTRYFQDIKHPDDRFRKLGIEIKPWRDSGRHILIIGMSGKGAVAEGFQPQMWERRTIDQLRRLTKRPLIYRPKPNWIGARPLPNAEFQRDVPLEEALKDCHAVVCYHSNVAVDAILSGVPAFCQHGVASVMCDNDMARIERPAMPKGRKQWASDIAYCQWTMDEMKSGHAWQYLVSEGLV